MNNPTENSDSTTSTASDVKDVNDGGSAVPEGSENKSVTASESAVQPTVDEQPTKATSEGEKPEPSASASSETTQSNVRSVPPPVSGGASGYGGTTTNASAPAVEVDALGHMKAEADRFKEAWMRSAADFDNFRKRTRREIDEAKKSGREDLLRELLPVFDNLERAIQSAQRATDIKAVVDGIMMIQKQFEGTITRSAITKVPTVGSAFDPSIHEAIQQVESADHAPGTVVAEVQAGYMHGERLVRAAMVVVAKPKTSSDNN